MQKHKSKSIANGGRPAKQATQRRAESRIKVTGVETGNEASSVKVSAWIATKAKMKAQSRPRIERASKDEVVKHNRLVPGPSPGCPIKSLVQLGRKTISTLIQAFQHLTPKLLLEREFLGRQKECDVCITF